MKQNSELTARMPQGPFHVQVEVFIPASMRKFSELFELEFRKINSQPHILSSTHLTTVQHEHSKAISLKG
jgi:hypothetical protein